MTPWREISLLIHPPHIHAESAMEMGRERAESPTRRRLGEA